MQEEVVKGLDRLIRDWTGSELLNTAGLVTLGTALLHGAGYLALRFRLRALGLDPSMEFLDERFLFVGAHFLVHLAIALSSLATLFAVLLAVAWLLPRRAVDGLRSLGVKLQAWATPDRLLWLGIVWAMLMVQLVMRHAFQLDDLLLRGLPCDPAWLRGALIADTRGPMALLFVGLVAGAIPPTLILARLARLEQRPRGSSVLLLLTVVLLLLLPVHFGIFTAGNSVPRLDQVEGESTDSRVWRVWQSDDLSAFLVERPGEPAQRRILLRPSEVGEAIEVVRHENLWRTLEVGKCKP